MADENKNKYDFLTHLLGEGDAMVCLDARLPKVDVPLAHKKNSALNLVLNLNFKRPIEIFDDGIYTTLAFNGRPHRCIIPFDAVWAIYRPETQKGQVWEGSFPKDLKLETEVTSLTSKSQAVEKVEQGLAGSKQAAPEKPGRPRKDRSHLRVIK
jgi:stringent starvation protein B